MQPGTIRTFMRRLAFELSCKSTRRLMRGGVAHCKEPSLFRNDNRLECLVRTRYRSMKLQPQDEHQARCVIQTIRQTANGYIVPKQQR